MKLKYVKVRDVKDPQYGSGGSVGIDFYIPTFNEKFINDLFLKNTWLKLNHFSPTPQNVQQIVNNPDISITIPKHTDLCIPSGIHMSIPEKTCLTAFNKSGIALKNKLVRGAELIDWDYQGEIHCHVINTSEYDQRVNPGQKIIQFVHIPVIKEEIEQLSTLEELYPKVSERGAGGFGSTGVQ